MNYILVYYVFWFRSNTKTETRTCWYCNRYKNQKGIIELPIFFIIAGPLKPNLLPNLNFFSFFLRSLFISSFYKCISPQKVWKHENLFLNFFDKKVTVLKEKFQLRYRFQNCTLVLFPIKFIYSEKATNFYEIFTLKSNVVPVKSNFRKILWPSQNIWTLPNPGFGLH